MSDALNAEGFSGPPCRKERQGADAAVEVEHPVGFANAEPGERKAVEHLRGIHLQEGFGAERKAEVKELRFDARRTGEHAGRAGRKGQDGAPRRFMQVEKKRSESDRREGGDELLLHRIEISRKPSHDEHGHPFARSRRFAQNQGS